MKRFVEGEDRRQTVLLPACVDDYVGEDNPVRVIEAFVGELDLAALGFGGVTPAATGRPSYHPATLLKLYVYGYLNRVQSSRRLGREARRNVEAMWLTGRLAPDFKTVADFRKDNGPAIRAVCRRFVRACRGLGLLCEAVVAIDGSKFKAVNNRDKNYTPHKLQRRIEQVEEGIARHLSAMDAADRQEGEVARAKSARLEDKIAALRERVRRFREMEEEVRAAPDQQVSLTDPDARSMATSGEGTGVVGYDVRAAVDAKHHPIVAHEATNRGHDRGRLSGMARRAREAMGHEALTVVAARVALLAQQVGDPPQGHPLAPRPGRVLGQHGVEPGGEGAQLRPWLHLTCVGELRRPRAHDLAHHFARDRQLAHDRLDRLAVGEIRATDQRHLVHPEHPLPRPVP